MARPYGDAMNDQSAELFDDSGRVVFSARGRSGIDENQVELANGILNRVFEEVWVVGNR